MQSEPVKFVVTEYFGGTATPTEIFTDLILSEINKNLWNSEQQSDIIESPTIPIVVPEERSKNGT